MIRIEIVTATELDMPDLSAVVEDTKRAFGFRNYWTGQGLHTLPARGLLATFVRLTDKAAYEYEQARGALTEYVKRPAHEAQYTLRYMRALDHLETCVNALHRASLVVDALRRDAATPQIAKNALMRPGEVKVINDIRDGTEHIDSFIQAGIALGDAVTIVAEPNALVFLGRRVKYRELARWIEKLDAVARELTDTPASSPAT